MCGITAVLSKCSNNNVLELLLNSLKELENRGYDSIGISIYKKIKNNDHELLNIKHCDSNFLNFENKVEYLKHYTNPILCGIGHTRWATHGGVNIENCHPHISNNGLFHLVHNGIIENYELIKKKLKKNNYSFYSKTDSEVIVNLLEYNYMKELNIIKSIQKTMLELQGTYGIALLFKLEPDNIYIFRNGSPLLIGENNDYIMATSEICGFVKQMKNYIILNHNDICILSNKGINFTEKIVYSENDINDINYSLSPKPYAHWTLKEINEQNESIDRAINNGARIHNNEIKLGGIEFLKKVLSKKNIYNNIILCGCGSSYYACKISEYYFKKYRTFNSIQVIDGGEFNIQDISSKDKTIIVLVSQSGETKDLHKVIDIINNNDCLTIGIVNVIDSLIARESSCGIYMNCGREKAVASTKSMTSSTLLLHLLSLWFYQQHNNYSRNINKEIEWCRKLSNQIYKLNYNIYNKINNYINKLDNNSLFILGKGKMEYVAKEGALKIKELCYIHAEGYSGSSLKHGPFALLNKDYPVILLIDKENFTKMMNVYQEVKSRNCYTLIITDVYNNLFNENDNVILINENLYFNEILYLIVLQNIAYYLSIKRNINPDKPRNLAKVVTVE